MTRHKPYFAPGVIDACLTRAERRQLAARWVVRVLVVMATAAAVFGALLTATGAPL